MFLALFMIASAGCAGGAGRSRTDDLMLAKHALYQLSYGPFFAPSALRKGEPSSAGCGSAFEALAKEAVVGPGGLEPPTSRLSGVCSNQLSYRPETIMPSFETRSALLSTG